MENKTKACEWAATPFNANQGCLEHAFQYHSETLQKSFRLFYKSSPTLIFLHLGGYRIITHITYQLTIHTNY